MFLFTHLVNYRKKYWLAFGLALILVYGTSLVAWSQTFTSGRVAVGSDCNWPYSAIATNPVDGKMYALWRKGANEVVTYMLIRWDGSGWTQLSTFTTANGTSSTIKVPDFSGATDNVSLAIDKTGQFHIAFSGISATANRQGIWYGLSPNGTSWSFQALQILPANSTNQSLAGAVIEVDPQNQPHVAFRHNIAVTPRTYTLRYYRFTGGSWVGETAITQSGSSNGGTVSNEIGDFDLAIDGNAKAHFSFRREINGTGRDGSLYYINNVSGSWSSPQELVAGATDQSQAVTNTIDTDAANKVHIVHSDYLHKLYYTTDVSGSFVTNPINGNVTGDVNSQHALRINANGDKFLVYNDNQSTPSQLNYAYQLAGTSGSSWTTGTGFTPNAVGRGGNYYSGLLNNDRRIMLLFDNSTTSTSGACNTFTRDLFYATATLPAPPVTATVSSINTTSPNPTNAASISFTVTFDKAITGLTTSNFSVTPTGVTGASVASVSGSGTIYTVVVNTGTGSGSLRLNLANSTGLTPTVTNVPFTTGTTVTIDKTGPTVSSVGVPANGTYRTGQALNFIVNFNDNVTVTGTPYLPITIGGSTVQANYISGTGTTGLLFRYTVVAGQQDMDGIQVGSSINVNGGTLRDGLGNGAVLALNSVASTTGVRIDAVAPTVSISSSAGASGSTTGTSPIPFMVTFSESVTGFVVNDLTVTGGTLSGFTGSGTTYTFSVTPTANELVTVNIATNVAQDAAGNGNTAATQFSITYQQPLVATAQDVTVNLGSNGTASLNASSVNNGSTGSGTLTYTIQKIVYGRVPEGNTLTLTTPNGTNFTAIRFASFGTPTSDANGNYRLGVCNAGNSTTTAQNSFVNRSTGSMDATNGSSANNNPTLGDPCPVTPKALAVQAAYSADAVSLTYDCSEAGKTQYVLLTVSNGSTTSTSVARVTVNAPPTATISSVTPNSGPRGATVTVTGTNLSGIGSTVTVNGATATVSGLSASGFTFVVPATATIGTGTLTIAAPCSQVLSTAFIVQQPQTPIPTLTSPVNGGTTNGFPIFAGTGQPNSAMTLYLNSAASPTFPTDANGNFAVRYSQALASGTYTVYAVNQVSGQTVSSPSTTINFTVDNTPPVPTVSSTSSSPTSTSPIPFSITFSEAVTGFIAADITVSNGTVASFSGSGTSYNLAITPSGSGTVTVSVPASSGAVDAVGNTNVASNSVSIIYQQLMTAQPTINTPANGSRTNATSISVTGLAPANSLVRLYNATTNTIIGNQQLAGGATAWTISIPLTTNATTTFYATAQRTGEAESSASSSLSVIQDAVAPTVTSVSVPANGVYRMGDVLSFTVNVDGTVLVTGTPQLPLTIGATSRQASYVSGNGSSQLTFTYTVQAGELDTDGITLGSALSLNGSTIQDAATNNATLTLNNVGSTSGVLVDAVAPSVSISSSAGANSSTTSISPIPFTITFSESVTGLMAVGLTVTGGTLSDFSGSGTLYTFNVTPTANGVVTVNVAANVAQDAAGNGNTAASPFSITYMQGVTPAPVVNSPVNGALITTNTPTYSGTAPAGSTVTVYVDNSSIGTTTATGGSWSFLQPSALTNASHSVRATAQLSGQAVSSNSNTATFTVDNSTVNVALSANAVCTNSPLSLTASAMNIGAPATYSLSSNPVGFASSGTSPQFLLTAPVVGYPTVYTLTVTATSNAGNASTTAVVTVNPLPTISITNLSSNYCKNATDVVLNGTPAGGVFTVDGTTVTTFSPNSLSVGQHTVVYSYTNGNGCSATASQAVTVNPVPTTTLVASGTITCSQTTVTLTASGGTTYQFSGPGSINQSGNTATVNAPGLYSVSVTSGSGCSSTTTVTVSQDNSVPSASITPSSATLTCANPSVNLVANGNGAYHWSTGANSPNITVNTADTYSLTVTNTNGCTAVASMQVSQDNNVPVPSLVASALSTVNQPISVTANGCSGTLNWQVQGGSGQANGAIYTLSTPGTYTVTATCTVGSCISPAASALQLTIQSPNTNFAITSVDMVNCYKTNPSRGEYTVQFTPHYSGQNGNQISFSVVNELPATTDPAPYTLRLYDDNPVITLVANQAGNGETRYVYNWLASCSTGSSPNQPPTTIGIGAQTLTLNQPYQLNLSSYFTDPEGQTLTYSAQGLPAGLTVAGNLLTGTPSQTGTFGISITAIDPGNLSVSTNFNLTVQTQPTSFAIAGVTLVSCEAIKSDQRRIRFTPQYNGLTGQPITFRVVNELAPTTQPGPYSLDLYTDNPVIELRAIQAGTMGEVSFSYNWLAACGSVPPVNMAPKVTQAIPNQAGVVGQSFSYSIPANTFTDPDGNALVLTASGLPAGLNLNGSVISGTPSVSSVSTVIITATDPGNLSVSTNFVLTINQVTIPPTQGFAITGVNLLNCLAVNPQLRLIRFSPQYSGLTGEPISFSVVNEMSPTTAAGPYELQLYIDNPVILLKASQAGTVGEVSFPYNWLAACGNPSGRISAEKTPEFSVQVLGNPVVGEWVEVVVTGANQQPLQTTIVNERGILVNTWQTPSASDQERIRLRVGPAGGVYLLKVEALGKRQTIKLIKH